jgi:DNA polymerase-4
MRELPSLVHLDADAFFVSVELARRPELRGRKVAVGGAERGIVSSANYAARAAGVYTPMPSRRALALCPDLVLLPHTPGLYGEVSRRLFDLAETLTPLVERRSIDEGYLDLAPCGFASKALLEEAVRGLQGRIERELGISVSIGLGTNKLVAAIASKLRKPRGFVVVPPGMEASFLAPLEVARLPGIGPKAEASLRAAGVERIGDLRARSEAELRRLLGRGWRDWLASARGEGDDSLTLEPEDAKSYSQQETFGSDLADFAQVERVAKRMLDELMPKVRADRKRVRTLTIKVRHPQFDEASAARSLDHGTDLEAPFYPWVARLLRQAWKRREAVRLVSVRLSGVDEGPEQLALFAEGEERRRRLAAVLDALNAGRREEPAVKHGHQLLPGRREKTPRRGSGARGEP